MNNKGFPLKKICETPPEIESPPISCHKYTGCTYDCIKVVPVNAG